MKYKLLAMLLTAAMLISPVVGFWHLPPPPDEEPPHTRLVALINGEYGTVADPYEFIEPEDNYCDNFVVTVGVVNVTDLFGYEFKLSWNPTYFNLVSYVVEAVWPSQFQVKPDASYDSSSPYLQVVTAVDPSLGVSGDILLATLTFHINNDVCWLQGNITGKFDLYADKLSNSCSQPIDKCSPTDANWKFVPVQPEIFIDPAEINCSKVGTTFEVTVWLKNIVKMTDFDVTIAWDGKQLTDPCNQGSWTVLIATKTENVVINEDVFPTAWRAGVTTKAVQSPVCGEYANDPVGYVHVALAMNSSFPLINGTVWLFKVTFTQCDPWYCGKQPLYTEGEEEHTWVLETGETDIIFWPSYISVKCPDPAWMTVGVHITATIAHFSFLPIPGDLDGSGHTGIEDLMIEAMYYGMTPDCSHKPAGSSANAWAYFYDLNNSGAIDVFDLVIVAKNFCRDTP
jgi:hypothetical protein